ncbi:FMN-linked oxidoreductase [Suillus decipiens]|nr:FMN-linked oxidoreductase [Suillus decipiens]
MSSSTFALFSPIRVGNIKLQHRVVFAPVTRRRASAEHVPSPEAPTYYAQRGSTPGTLLVSEATFISQKAGGSNNVPGIYTDAHVEAWKEVTEAVHEKGSFILLQLWVLGRTAEIDVLAKENNSPYARRTGTPRALTTNEIKDYVATYAAAGKSAIGAGFDSVEIHGANGYLIDQFMQDVSNQRTDEYGGSIENRARFALEITDAVVEAVGAERTGFRISPWGTVSDPKLQFSYVVGQLRKHKLAYVHVVEPMPEEITAEINSDSLRSTFISTNGHTRNSAFETVDNKGGLIGFWRSFMPNPDLPFRLLNDLALEQGDQATWYMAGNSTAAGYSDWPFAPENSQRLKNEF